MTDEVRYLLLATQLICLSVQLIFMWKQIKLNKEMNRKIIKPWGRSCVCDPLNQPSTIRTIGK